MFRIGAVGVHVLDGVLEDVGNGADGLEMRFDALGVELQLLLQALPIDGQVTDEKVVLLETPSDYCIILELAYRSHDSDCGIFEMSSYGVMQMRPKSTLSSSSPEK